MAETEQNNCAICFLALNGENQTTTKCNHTFHKPCLHKWYKANKIRTCPLCRRVDKSNKSRSNKPNTYDIFVRKMVARQELMRLRNLYIIGIISPILLIISVPCFLWVVSHKSAEGHEFIFTISLFMIILNTTLWCVACNFDVGTKRFKNNYIRCYKDIYGRDMQPKYHFILTSLPLPDQ